MNLSLYDTVKKFIKKSKLILRVYQTISKKLNDLSYWIEILLNKQEEECIIQIGSNDGKTNDPIYDLINANIKWKGYFIEPVPYLFRELKNNYPENERYKFFNVAINDGSIQDFFYVDEKAKENLKGLPKYWNQLGSFNRTHILKHLDGVLEPYIITAKIKGVTLHNFLRTNDIQDIGLLQIDAEGYDWEILKQLNLNEITPKIILLEHKHLDYLDKKELLEKLKDYLIYKFGQDIICISKNFNLLRKVYIYILLNGRRIINVDDLKE